MMMMMMMIFIIFSFFFYNIRPECRRLPPYPAGSFRFIPCWSPAHSSPPLCNAAIPLTTTYNCGPGRTLTQTFSLPTVSPSYSVHHPDNHRLPHGATTTILPPVSSRITLLTCQTSNRSSAILSVGLSILHVTAHTTPHPPYLSLHLRTAFWSHSFLRKYTQALAQCSMSRPLLHRSGSHNPIPFISALLVCAPI